MSDHDATIHRWMPHARKLACIFWMRVKPHAELEDLECAAYAGLLAAVRKYDPGKGSQFQTFAERKIQWSMRDWIRDADRLSRLHQRRIMRGELPKVRWQQIPDERRERATDASLLDHQPPPWHRQQAWDLARLALDALPARQRLAVVLYYYEDMTMQEIGVVLGCDKSNVSLMLTSARQVMFRRLRFRERECLGMW